jgi:hypothetical protein
MGVMRVVRDDTDGGAILMEFAEEIHDGITVLRV